MSLENTVEDLIQQVRDVTDEDNTSDVKDEFIIRMLNRAQQDLISEITRKYNPHFMKETYLTSSDFTTDSNGITRVATLPSQGFGYRINYVEAKVGDTWYSVSQVPHGHTLPFDTTNAASLPVVYAIQGNKLYVYPDTSQLTQLRIRYQFRAPKLNSTQGRVTAYSSANGTITLDSLGSSLSTSVDDLSAFINIIDSQTGVIKGTCQVSGINTSTKKLTVKSASLSRSTVYGYTVSTSLPSDIALDDYVCLASGTCVPYLSMDLSNYHVELASFHVKRALGTVDGADFSERDRIIDRVQKMWSGRENTMKIKRTRRGNMPNWTFFFRGS